MKSLSFLFCIFILSLFLIHPVTASEENQSIILTGDSQTAFSGTGGYATSGVSNYQYIWFENPENTKPGGIKFLTIAMPKVNVYPAITKSSYWSSVTYKKDSTIVGTGQIGYVWSGSTCYILATFNEDFDISGYTGQTKITMADSSFNFYFSDGSGKRTSQLLSSQASNSAVFGNYEYLDSAWKGLALVTGKTYTLQTRYEETYYYNYTVHDYFNRLELNIMNPSGWQKRYIVNNGYLDIINETSLNTNTLDQPWSIDSANYSWTFQLINAYGNSKTTNIIFNLSLPTSGAVSFNKSSYTTPENVGVNYDITNLDLSTYEYWIVVTGNNGGTPHYVSNDFYDITTSSGVDTFTISPGTLSLPFNMQAELRTYDKTTGNFNTLAVSEILSYNPESIETGTIWTAKTNYNISEIFHIEFETNYNTVQIELISSDFYDLRTMEGPGSGHLGYLFNDPHNFTAYLIEDGIKTNHVDFTVSADTPFLNIHVDTVPVNQGFCFSYYTDNTSDTITGYRPDGSIFYGPTTNLITLEKVDICGPSSSSPAGIYTMSLLHDGVDYYNDTIVMTSANEYIYFESSKYETGDRMIIHYYIMDRQQRIRLSDSLGTAVVTWTCDAFYITPNMGNSLWFSLIDNNEYGLNMNASIDAGTFRTGNWKVEIIGIDGKPLTDYGTYDYTTVNKKIETSEDQTTEFILLIFSPEGLFLIFTSVLMLAGLVAAKHPAGGAAGAAVGVGFGVFFGVLPVWLLLLMVILLVVLAGVGTAVYFKGK